MAVVHVGEQSVGPVVRFLDRLDAGRKLAEWIEPAPDPAAVVFALPRGGVPVGRGVADVLGCEIRPVLVRKLPIPYEPEMGFGAVTIDGTVTLNRPAMHVFGLTDEHARAIAEEVRGEVERRASIYPGGWPLPDVTDRRLWLIDDGLATGYSMIASAQMLLALEPASMTLAVPCSPAESLARVEPLVDEAWCLVEQRGRPFAVASFYSDFHDLTDSEVRELLVDDVG